VILISDFLVPLEQLEKRLAFLRARRHELMVMRVLDPMEVELSGNEPITLVDSESGKKIYVDPKRERESYQLRFKEHQRQLTEILGRNGIEFTTMLTNQPLEGALFELLHLQSKRVSGGGRYRAVMGRRASS
jgi:hypothetical protein